MALALMIFRGGKPLVLGLLLSLFLGGLQQCDAASYRSCSANIKANGDPEKPGLGHHCQNIGDGLGHCFRLSMVDPSTGKELSHIRGCQYLSEAVLQCLRHDRGLAGEGNCFKPKIDKSAWDTEVAACIAKVGGDPGGQPGHVPREPHHVEMCTCNDGYGCNGPIGEKCQCDASYGLCGAKPCHEYRCSCMSGSPAHDKLFPDPCTSNTDRICLGEEITGCYTVSQERNENLYKDCALPGGTLDCIHSKMDKAWGPEHSDCVTGTNGEWYDAAKKCGGDPGGQLTDEERKTRIKACRCAGDMCNYKLSISWRDTGTRNPNPDIHSGGEGGTRDTGLRRRLFMMIVWGAAFISI